MRAIQVLMQQAHGSVIPEFMLQSSVDQLADHGFEAMAALGFEMAVLLNKSPMP